MNDDEPAPELEALKAEHRELDEQIAALSAEPTGDQLEIARLKKRKLRLKDQIEQIADRTFPTSSPERPSRWGTVRRCRAASAATQAFSAAMNSGSLMRDGRIGPA